MYSWILFFFFPSFFMHLVAFSNTSQLEQGFARMLRNKQLTFKSRFHSDSMQWWKYYSQIERLVLRHINNLLQLFFIPEGIAHIPNPGKQMTNLPLWMTGKHQTRQYRYLEKQNTKCFVESSQSSIPKENKFTDLYCLCHFLSQIKWPNSILCTDT